jgi:hypothetical protein
MGHIYRNATKVLAWLGKEDARSAIAQFEDLSYNRDLYIEDMKGFRLARIACIWDARGLYRFFDRDWFLRIWIVQEFALAQDVQFFASNDNLCYSNFSKAMDVLDELLRVPTDERWRDFKGSGEGWKWSHLLEVMLPCFALWQIRQTMLHRADENVSICDLGLYFFTRSSCRLEHDRVYAFLAMAGKDLAITPDYAKPVEAVWRDLVISSIANGSPRVLGYARLPSRERGRMCSYAPDPKNFDEYQPHPADKTSREQQMLPLHLVFREDRILSMHGVLVDTVANIECGLERILVQVHGLRHFYERCKRMSSIKPSPYRESFTSVFARSIVADKAYDQGAHLHNVLADKLSICLVSYLYHESSGDEIFVPHLKVAEICGSFDWTLTRVDADRNASQHRYQCPSPKHLVSRKPCQIGISQLGEFITLNEPFKTIISQDYRLAVSKFVRQRSLFRTSRGYFGFGIPDMRPGDLVIIPHGLLTPYILRPVDENTLQMYKDAGLDIKPDYQIVGECYLHGWMDGTYFGHEVDVEQTPEVPNKADKTAGSDQGKKTNMENDEDENTRNERLEEERLLRERHKVERNSETDPRRRLKSTSFLIY